MHDHFVKQNKLQKISAAYFVDSKKINLILFFKTGLQILHYGLLNQKAKVK
jgi:hypothetical protein